MKRLMLGLLVAIGAGCAGSSAPPDPASAAIARAARFLWSQQGADGGWHSPTYGLLRSGQSLTPFVLVSLLEVPEGAPPGAVDRALKFIEAGVDRDGAVGRAEPGFEDYPNYATSLAVLAFVRAGRQRELDRLIACLRRQQFSEELGWMRDHPAYGAWGMGGPPRRPPHTGHLDLSMTRHVIEALSAGDVKLPDPVFERAALFLKRCQNPDGGFIFSPVLLEVNKAGLQGELPRSYGTTTADGILSLLALGVDPSDPRVRAGVDWLIQHHRVDYVPGFPDEASKGWAWAMIYYYLASSARVFRALGHRGWQKGLVESLGRRQKEDGSFRNPNFQMKEDDPLIATASALRALTAAR